MSRTRSWTISSSFCGATRNDPRILQGASPRASARAHLACQGHSVDTGTRLCASARRPASSSETALSTGCCGATPPTRAPMPTLCAASRATSKHRISDHAYSIFYLLRSGSRRSVHIPARISGLVRSFFLLLSCNHARLSSCCCHCPECCARK